MTGMILAAGLGTRLRPITEKIPKPAVPFLNIPLILYSHFLLLELGIRRAIVNTHHLPHRITNLFQQMRPSPLSVVFSDEQPQILGTGGALKKVRGLLDKKAPILLVNSDSLFLDIDLNAIRSALADFEKTDAISVVLSISHPEVGSRFGGVWQNAKGEVLGLGKERPIGTTTGSHYIGLQILSPRILEVLPEGPSDLWKDGLNIAISRGLRVLNQEIQADWYETGDPESFLQATRAALKMIASGNKDSFLFRALAHHTPNFQSRPSPLRGLNLKIEDSAIISDFFLIGDRVQISENCNLQGFGVIGEACKIGKDCIIENSVVLPNTSVKAGSTLRNCIYTGS